MSLLDAPEFDAAGERRKRNLLIGGVATFVVLLIGFWLIAGRPVDWPWHWVAHLRGRAAVNAFFKDLEKNDQEAAYGVWQHDPRWKEHPQKYAGYPFERFQKDWNPTSHDSDYGQITSHRIAAARLTKGGDLLVGIFVNGRKSKAINLIWASSDSTLSFSPDDLQFFEGPGGISRLNLPALPEYSGQLTADSGQ
jgi:hypothetical protein